MEESGDSGLVGGIIGGQKRVRPGVEEVEDILVMQPFDAFGDNITFMVQGIGETDKRFVKLVSDLLQREDLPPELYAQFGLTMDEWNDGCSKFFKQSVTNPLYAYGLFAVPSIFYGPVTVLQFYERVAMWINTSAYKSHLSKFVADLSKAIREYQFQKDHGYSSALNQKWINYYASMKEDLRSARIILDGLENQARNILKSIETTRNDLKAQYTLYNAFKTMSHTGVDDEARAYNGWREAVATGKTTLTTSFKLWWKDTKTDRRRSAHKAFFGSESTVIALNKFSVDAVKKRSQKMLADLSDRFRAIQEECDQRTARILPPDSTFSEESDEEGEGPEQPST